MRIETDLPPAPYELTEEEQGLLAGIVQEALANVRRHAPKDAVTEIRLYFEPTYLMLEITDDGGTESAPPALRLVEQEPEGGQGIAWMRDQLDLHEGKLDAGPQLGPGWLVRAWLPVQAGEHQALGRLFGPTAEA
ncbi:sensor histidine kinase [Kineosporia babensis]|uniref:histidine kinase n=1 Tax=Kineosporia babensis TaxID=499548 RepID=A0A9X1NDN9_9ACTN|nr:hypothetical protein [Kineosporia babensis]MCD5311899.1 hypothetical protein [Kineosporia babensis]